MPNPNNPKNPANVTINVNVQANLSEVLDLLNQIKKVVDQMPVSQSDLNAQLVALQAAVDAESAALNGFIADALSAFSHLEQLIAAGAPQVDLTAEAALVAAALQKVTDATTSIASPDAQAKTEAAK